MPRKTVKRSQLTNVGLVNRYLKDCRAGVLAQCFLIEAVNRYAAQVLADEAETKRQMAESFVSGEAWIVAAKEWQQLTQANYGWDLTKS